MPAATDRSAAGLSLISAVAAIALLAGATSAWASPAIGGCADVNAGFFNVTNSTTPNLQTEISGFNVGDQVNFTVTGNASGQSHFELLNSPKNKVLLTVAIIDGFVVVPGDFWGRLEGGLTVLTAEGVAVRGSASWDGASDYSGYTLQGTVNVPLN